MLRTLKESIKNVKKITTDSQLQVVDTQDHQTTQLLHLVAVEASSHSKARVSRLVDRDQNARFCKELI